MGEIKGPSPILSEFKSGEASSWIVFGSICFQDAVLNGTRQAATRRKYQQYIFTSVWGRTDSSNSHVWIHCFDGVWGLHFLRVIWSVDWLVFTRATSNQIFRNTNCFPFINYDIKHAGSWLLWLNSKPSNIDSCCIKLLYTGYMMNDVPKFPLCDNK